MKKKIFVISAVILAICTICAVCVIALSASNEPTTDIVGHNLSLNDSVNIVYYADFKNLPENAEKGVLIWTSVQDKYTYGSESTKLTNIRGTYQGYSEYLFTGVSAKMMSQDIYAKSYIKVGDDITYGPLDKYSVLQYCYNKKDSTTMVQGGTIRLGELVEKMLEYGAWAQKYFGYNLDRLANEEYYQVRTVNGTLPDGTTSGLYKSGSTVTLTADSNDTNCWKNSSDVKVGEEKALVLTVTREDTYTASFTEEENSIIVWNGTTATAFDGGSGTATDPYLIATPEQFAYFAQRNNTVKPTGEYYKLTADLYFNFGNASEWGESFNGNDATNIVVGPLYNLNDHGSNANPFAGTFDGDGYTISGFYGKRTSGNTMGIFGSAGKGQTATIKNLVITNSYFEAQGAVGALIGQTSGGTTNISNVFVTDSVYIVSSANYAGGIVGHNGGNGYGNPTLNISNCVNGATVSASGCDDVGGILGNVNDKTGHISNCLNYGKITGNNNVSGIMGLGNNKNSTVSYSVNIGAVIGSSPCQITCSTSGSKKPTVSNCFGINSTFGNANVTVTGCVSIKKAEFLSEGFLPDKGTALAANWTELASESVNEICVPTALLNAVRSDIKTSLSYSQSETDFVPVIRFAMTSDVHISKTTDVEAARFIELFESAYDYAESSADYSALDAVIVAGDFTNWGKSSEYDAFKATAESGLREGTEFITIIGNHELKTSNGAEVYCQKFNTTLDKHVVINGIHFIGISPNYSDESIAYLEQELAAAAAAGGPDTPIIVFTHHHIKDTVYVSDEWAMNATKSAQFTQIFNQYPQVIFFSGHSHGPVNIPTAVWQGGFTAFGTGTLTYIEMTSGMSYGTVPPNSHDAAQYYIVEISTDNRVRVMPYDLITDSFFKTPSNLDDPKEQLIYYIDSSKDPSLFRYTDRAANADAPYFAPNAALNITDVTAGGACLTIPQAFDSDCIYSYTIECTSAVDGKKFTYSCFSEFYFQPMPETVSFTLSELEAGTTYTVKVTPVDCYGIEGDPIQTSFTTAAAEQGVVYTSENPVNFYGTFTNFDSATKLTRSSSTPAYDRTISGDVFAGAYNTKNTDDNSYIELAGGKGYNGSKAIGVSSDNKDNHGLYIFATDSNGNSTDFSDMAYLRVWVDFTDVAFRKACFGLVSESGALYDTDEEDKRNDQYFWYLPEGETEWVRYTHGTDGCFGDAQNSDVKGFKGWMAFPISDFVYRQNTGNVSAVDGRLAYHSNHICGVYLFWDYSDKTTCTGNKFYLDEIAIVEDYTVFDSYPS